MSKTKSASFAGSGDIYTVNQTFPNTYNYVSSSPLGSLDPYGLDTLAVPNPSNPAIYFDFAKAVRNGLAFGTWAARALQIAAIGAAATTAAVVTSPVTATAAIGVVVDLSITAIAPYFQDQSQISEQEYIEQIGYEPNVDMYNALVAQIQ